MNYTISNGKLTLTVSALGAEIVSVKDGEGCEYIWQGDPKYWASKAPVMFPICGRLPSGRYSFEGKSYEMIHHGFTRKSEFALTANTPSSLEFTLSSNEVTRAQYPFEFDFKITYTLTDSTVEMKADIINKGESTMPAAFGAHPGFNVPLDNGSFEDWYVEFDEECTPNLFIFSENLLDSGMREAYPLKDGKIIPLRHSLFDIDAIFLSHVAKKATLKSEKSNRSVTLTYPECPYLGIWHKPQSDAPYVCIEPWCGIPTIEGMSDDIMKKNDMFHIRAGSKKTVKLWIDFN